MAHLELSCVKNRAEIVGRGLHRCVLRSGSVAIKIHLPQGKKAELLRRAREVDERNRELRKKVDFLPEYYGTVITGMKRGGITVPVIATFHEYVEPIRSVSLGILREVLRLIARAGDMGYLLDMKPSNFGWKDGKVLYLDEYGIGREPIPPDVMEDLVSLVDEFMRRMRLMRAGRTRRNSTNYLNT
ncbi:MAG: hypothetical protein QW567_02025 [Candidatus Hadarchaeales archaeon]